MICDNASVESLRLKDRPRDAQLSLLAGESTMLQRRIFRGHYTLHEDYLEKEESGWLSVGLL